MQINTSVNSQNYTYFEIIGSTDEYTLLAFTLCHSEAPGGVKELIDVWEDNGKIETFTKNNAEPNGKYYPIKTGCLTLATPFMVFGKKDNGQPEGFILGLKLVTKVAASQS